jgi:hypothetical protein
MQSTELKWEMHIKTQLFPLSMKLELTLQKKNKNAKMLLEKLTCAQACLWA